GLGKSCSSSHSVSSGPRAFSRRRGRTTASCVSSSLLHADNADDVESDESDTGSEGDGDVYITWVEHSNFFKRCKDRAAGLQRLLAWALIG
ncbi:unnamed protein product, partial [Amoebophrya sp. A25]